MKNKFYILLIALISAMFGGCSDDADPIVDVKTEFPELLIDGNNIDVAIGGTVPLNILQGAGEYNAFSLEKDIVDVEVKDNEIFLKGISIGRTSIMVLDQSGACKLVDVASFYDKIILSKDEIVVKLKIGEKGKGAFDIQGGNGDYRITTEENQDIISELRISNENHVSFDVLQVGTTTLTITDKMERTALLKVIVEETSYPYSPEEIKEIKNKTSKGFRYMSDIPLQIFEGKIYDNQTADDGRIFYKMESLLDWDPLNFRIDFRGDLSVGVKEEATLNYDYKDLVDQEIKFEIIKNNDKLIWAIYYYIDTDHNNKRELKYGYFIRPIKEGIENIDF